jgi:integrase
MPSLKLTDSLCKGATCPTGKTQEDFWDTQEPGLGLRVTSAGRKTWCWRFRWQGERKRLTLLQYGDAPPVLFDDGDGGKIRKPAEYTLKAARIEAARLRVLLASGMNPANEADAAKTRRTMKDANTVEAVMTRRIEALRAGKVPGKKGPRSERYLQDIKDRLGLHVLPSLGSKPIVEVRPHHIAAILSPLESRGQAATHNAVLRMLRPLFSFAKVSPNPAADFHNMPEETKEAFFSVPELVRLWKALDDPAAGVHPLTALAIRLNLLTLNRSGEVAGFKLSELDRENRLWNIPAGRMKGRRPEVVPLSPLALDVIDAALASPTRPVAESLAGEQVCLFPSPRDHTKPIQQNAMSRAFARTRRIAGLQGNPATLHNLRHSGATALAASGVSRHIVTALLAHSPTTGSAVTSRYDHYDLLSERRVALATWARMVGNELDGTLQETNVVNLRG